MLQTPDPQNQLLASLTLVLPSPIHLHNDKQSLISSDFLTAPHRSHTYSRVP
jgi:hypothetical protein